MTFALEEGTVLRNRYKLTKIVGHGGMGNVYRAEDLRLPGRLCAIKEVRPDANATPEMRRQAQGQFLREASLLAQLDHPNLPKVSDFFSEEGLDYLVMDYVPGKDLKQLIDESRSRGEYLSEDRVLSWANQIMDAIAYLHQQDPPVLHRDIKPANIKLTPDNRIKLVDFGLAKLMAADDSRTITVIQGRGTAFYTPLEQYGGESEHTDVRSDIYAFGATMFHLLTGHPPPEAKARFLNPQVIKLPHEINRKISPKVSEAVAWALEIHPDQRPENVAAFKRVLLGLKHRPISVAGSLTDQDLVTALGANQTLVMAVLILFFLAMILTLF